MHRIGLHGKAIVPFILGYGCNVPAIMSTRIMEEKRDRILAAALATLVPCAARLSVVFGLVAFYLGPTLALLIYLYNIVVIAFTAKDPLEHDAGRFTWVNFGNAGLPHPYNENRNHQSLVSDQRIYY